jgi:hypothetical protein
MRFLESLPESSNEKMLREAFERSYEALVMARAEARGMGRMLLVVVAARGFAVNEATRARVLACADAARLERWGRNAVGVKVFEEDGAG